MASTLRELHHFYHVYADGTWQDKAVEHVRALKQYGLYDNLSSFNIGCVGSVDNVARVVEFLDSQGVNYSLVAHEPTGWEQVTLDPLWEMAKTHQNDYFLYCHTKGAANYAPVNENWRRGMTRNLVVEWGKCVQAMDDGISTVGCHYYRVNPDNPNPFWGGNFWWATGTHINLLEKCSREHRHCAEAWIGTLKDSKIYKPYDVWPVVIGTFPEPY
jgi:hypothetical protein